MNEMLQPMKNCYRRELKLDLPPGSYFMYRSHNNMGIDYEPSVAQHANGFDVEFASSDVIIAGNESKKIFTLVGAVTAYRSYTFFILRRKATNMHSIEVRQPDIMEGDTPEEIVVLKGTTGSSC